MMGYSLTRFRLVWQPLVGDDLSLGLHIHRPRRIDLNSAIITEPNIPYKTHGNIVLVHTAEGKPGMVLELLIKRLSPCGDKIKTFFFKGHDIGNPCCRFIFIQCFTDVADLISLIKFRAFLAVSFMYSSENETIINRSR
jgi:hypothetical protein